MGALAWRRWGATQRRANQTTTQGRPEGGVGLSVNRKWTIAIRPVVDQKPRKITKILGLNGKGFSVVTPYHKARSGFLYKMLMPLNIHKPGTHSDSVPAQGESRIAPESTCSSTTPRVLRRSRPYDRCERLPHERELRSAALRRWFSRCLACEIGERQHSEELARPVHDREPAHLGLSQLVSGLLQAS